jgi:hypothetical protein
MRSFEIIGEAEGIAASRGILPQVIAIIVGVEKSMVRTS